MGGGGGEEEEEEVEEGEEEEEERSTVKSVPLPWKKRGSKTLSIYNSWL